MNHRWLFAVSFFSPYFDLLPFNANLLLLCYVIHVLKREIRAQTYTGHDVTRAEEGPLFFKPLF